MPQDGRVEHGGGRRAQIALMLEVLAMNKADEISQAERRRILENDRKVPGSTFFAHARASADDERGGRFAAAGKQTVIGISPISYPQMPEGNPWRDDPVPSEGPRGYAIDEQEPTGEKFEIEASRTASVDAGVGDGTSDESK